MVHSIVSGRHSKPRVSLDGTRVSSFPFYLQVPADTAGTTAHFFRIFPHTVVTLVANEVRLLALSRLLADQYSSSWLNTVKYEETI